ncbi:hypothetical protein Bca52824_019780 [Brassica carinata]|uniref:Uncharacterized protein n=1 Tax=Brassica carinata TaxID=52824 RepID=A0A8X8B005_BRACI|nr:hypothetical protein Bca52824_019780 [Brassica carinata]
MRGKLTGWFLKNIPLLCLYLTGMIEDMAKHLVRTKAEKQKALSSGSADTLKDSIKTKAASGEMQQWFREGVAGNDEFLMLLYVPLT